ENILKAKLEILDGLKEGSPLIINADNDMLSGLDIKGFRLIRCSMEKKADVYANNIIETAEGSYFQVNVLGEKGSVKLPAAGRHNIINALLALAAGKVFDIPVEDMCKALQLYEPSGMRQRVKVVKGITFIEDCYNASPDSVNASLSVLKNMTVKRRIAVLGDMLELGDIAVSAHNQSANRLRTIMWIFCSHTASFQRIQQEQLLIPASVRFILLTATMPLRKSFIVSFVQMTECS
ncbi:MAG TPA: Mur ligase family protein, partial [Clostridiales bacterium]|nr:Mur ligase family protein [Clostridiales bacterium]